ncbi:MAG TPA: hypothetical protein VEL28_04895 [Candidatus Binatia bacterium]|nr:hypothetical protein [Candidatus Binatia bacterium]
MKKIVSIMAAAALGLVILAPVAATAADTCLQFSGLNCDLSGDLGFFHFSAKLPKNGKKAVSLPGRACGTGTVDAAASVNTDETFVNIHGTFSCDATNGNINAALPVATANEIGTVGSGDAAYGSTTGFDNGPSCTVTVVDCATEPGVGP